MHYVGGQNYSLLWERERERWKTDSESFSLLALAREKRHCVALEKL